MNWDNNLDTSQSLQLSDIPLKSEIKPRSPLAEASNPKAQFFDDLNPDSLSEKNSPSTNFGSDLQPAMESLTTKQRNTFLGLNDHSVTTDQPPLKNKIQGLLRIMEELEKNEILMHQRFVEAAEVLKQSLQESNKRNMQIKLQLDSLRKELHQRRQQMKTLIHLLRNSKGTKQLEPNHQPRPLQTLKQYESQKFLQLAERQQSRAPTSEEKNQKKIKTLHGRRTFLREQSDSVRLFKNY